MTRESFCTSSCKEWWYACVYFDLTFHQPGASPNDSSLIDILTIWDFIPLLKYPGKPSISEDAVTCSPLAQYKHFIRSTRPQR